MRKLFAVTVLVAVGSVFFCEGFPQRGILMVVGVVLLLAGIMVAYRHELKTRKSEAK